MHIIYFIDCELLKLSLLIESKSFFFFFYFVFSLPEILMPPKSEGSPLLVEILKNCPKAVFDSSKEALGCTERDAEDPTFKKKRLLKKSRKTSKNYRFWCFG